MNPKNKKLEIDQVNKLEKNGTVQEVTIKAQLEHNSISEPIRVKAIVDSGAGKSYLIAGKSFTLPFIERISNKHPMVGFPDGTEIQIEEKLRCDISLLSIDEEHTFTTRDTQLLIIRTEDHSSPGRENPDAHILLGRDLTKLFKLDIYAGQVARIKDVIMCAETPSHPGVAERLFYLKTTIPQRHLETMPKFVIQEDDDTNQFEMIPRESETVGEHAFNDPIKVEIGDPDELAPWGRLHIRIPWKGEARPDLGRQAVWTRDAIQCKRLEPLHRDMYREAKDNMIQGNFVVSTETSKIQPLHFIATRPVFQTKRATTKCRLCLDARAINKFTHTGRVDMTGIWNSLILFRTKPAVAIYDLDKAFWQVKYHPTEWGWFSTIINGDTLVFTSMIFGSNFSPAGLERAIQTVLERADIRLRSQPPMEPDEPARPLQHSYDTRYYVDDFCQTAHCKEELLVACEWTRWILRKFGFGSSKFVTNGDPALAAGTHPFLGYTWHLPDDTLQIKSLESEPGPERWTVADIVRRVARFYDPLGLALKTQLAGRTLIRDAFLEHKDKKLGSAVWKAPVTSTEVITNLHEWEEMARHPTQPLRRKVETNTLHIFADASQTAWVCTVYDARLQLITAKGGLVNPRFTIPRAELIALHNACAEGSKIFPLLKSEKIFLYTDSECNVYRLHNRNSQNHKLSAFEGKRIRDIHEMLAQLHKHTDIVVAHIPGDINLADHATRPWSREVERTLDLRTLSSYTSIKPGHTRFVPGEEPTESVPNDFETDTVRFIMTRANTKLQTQKSAEAPELEDEEIENDDEETMPEGEPLDEWLLRVRKSQETNGVKLSPEHTIDQFGCIRFDDRLVIAEVDAQLKQQIIRRLHQRKHQGITATRRDINQHYKWKGMNNDIKKFVRECQICQQNRLQRTVRCTVGQALQIQDIESVPVGSIVGIDVVTIETADGENPSCILTSTCLISKWIRAEVLCTQVSDEIVQALERSFTNTHYPLVLVMDNAPAFHSKNMRRFAARYNIRLSYLPPHASAYAGWIERSHQQILSSLRVLVASHPTRSWDTLVSSACQLANSRPYNTDSPLCPLDMVYPNSNRPDPDRTAGNIEELMNLAGISHLRPSDDANMQQYEARWRDRRRKQLKTYEYVFNKTRRDVKSQLQRRLREPTHQLAIGTYVRVYRPTLNKVKARWSTPALVIEIPSSSTRKVKRDDGRVTIEWIGNLSPSESPGVFRTESES